MNTFTLSSGLEVTLLKQNLCWYLCIIKKESRHKIFKINDIVAVSVKQIEKIKAGKCDKND